MSHPLSFLLRLPGRVAGWAAVVATATLVACGGGGGSTPPPAPAPSATVSGTAASGAPLANLVVTLKDSTNHAVTATTSVSGDFTLDTSGLAPPFLLQVTTPGGASIPSGRRPVSNTRRFPSSETWSAGSNCVVAGRSTCRRSTAARWRQIWASVQFPTVVCPSRSRSTSGMTSSKLS